MIKDKIAQRLFGIASILLVCVIGMGVFMFSVNGTAASEKKENVNFDFPEELTQQDMAKLQNSTNNNGKYMMQLSVVKDQEDYSNLYVLVWNSSTGKSIFYYGGTKNNSIKAAGSGFRLPSNPL